MIFILRCSSSASFYSCSIASQVYNFDLQNNIAFDFHELLHMIINYTIYNLQLLDVYKK